MTRIRSLFVLLALAAPFASCSKPAAPVTQVDLSLTPSAATGSTVSPVILSGRAVNSGGNPVWYTEGCGSGAGVRFQFFDPNGARVYLSDPRVVTACVDMIVPLVPGGEERNELSFTGTIFVAVEGGYEQVDAPFGTYTVHAEFKYLHSVESPSTQTTETASTTFRWEPAPAD